MGISSTGTSDPYVKFKIGRKEVFRSKIIHKNLNPVWEEKACIIVDHLREPLYIKVSYSIAFPLLNLTLKSLFNGCVSCLWRTFQQRLLLTALIQNNVTYMRWDVKLLGSLPFGTFLLVDIQEDYEIPLLLCAFN